MLPQMVGLYAKWMIPGLLPFIWSLVLMKVRSCNLPRHDARWCK